MQQTYEAMVLTAPMRLERERRTWRAPGPGEVCLRVLRVGVCGTDLALWSGSYVAPLPLVLGHELVGEVVAVGAGVSRVQIGQRVVPDINATCLARGASEPCLACRSGLDRHCTERSVLGIISHDGGFAEFCYVPAGAAHVLPVGLSEARAVFAEPAAAAWQTFAMTGSPRGSSVIVLGPGRLGALVVAAARDAGARVAAVGRSAASLERASRFGAHAVFAHDDLVAAKAWAGGLGADLVVECTGSAERVGAALSLVRPRGTVAIKSTPGTAPTVDLTKVVVDELRLVGSRCGDIGAALTWLAACTWPIESMVERSFSLAESAEALRLAAGAGKLVVLPPSTTQEPAE